MPHQHIGITLYGHATLKGVVRTPDKISGGRKSSAISLAGTFHAGMFRPSNINLGTRSLASSIFLNRPVLYMTGRLSSRTNVLFRLGEPEFLAP